LAARKLIEEMVMDVDYALDSFQREQPASKPPGLAAK
jgi:hypothetical protein